MGWSACAQGDETSRLRRLKREKADQRIADTPEVETVMTQLGRGAQRIPARQKKQKLDLAMVGRSKMPATRFYTIIITATRSDNHATIYRSRHDLRPLCSFRHQGDPAGRSGR